MEPCGWYHPVIYQIPTHCFLTKAVSDVMLAQPGASFRPLGYHANKSTMKVFLHTLGKQARVTRA